MPLGQWVWASKYPPEAGRERFRSLASGWAGIQASVVMPARAMYLSKFMMSPGGKTFPEA